MIFPLYLQWLISCIIATATFSYGFCKCCFHIYLFINNLVYSCGVILLKAEFMNVLPTYTTHNRGSAWPGGLNHSTAGPWGSGSSIKFGLWSKLLTPRCGNSTSILRIRVCFRFSSVALYRPCLPTSVTTFFIVFEYLWIIFLFLFCNFLVSTWSELLFFCY